jgi:hypothetical protein
MQKSIIFCVLLIVIGVLFISCSNSRTTLNTNPLYTPCKTATTTEHQYITSMFTINRIWAGRVESIFVEIIPKNKVKANTYYRVGLYENGKLREQQSVVWNQPEINVKTMKPVRFYATRQESQAYCMENDLSNIFSVKIYEVPSEGE